MKVLVLGGTGAIGTHLVRLLASSGVATFVTSRTTRTPESNLHYIQGDAQNLTFLSSTLSEHWDAVIDFMIYSTARFKARIGQLLSSTSQYIFMSSARVYADSALPLKEESVRLLDVSQDQQYLATDEYALAKARQEDLLRASNKSNWTIIRPYITYSEKRLQLGALETEEWLYRALHGRKIVLLGDISQNQTTLTYGLDVARGISSIVGNPRAYGEAFHITAQKSLRWIEVFEIYAKVLRKHLGFEPGLNLQGVQEFLKCKPNRHQIMYDRLYHRRFDCTKISQFVNTQDFAEPSVKLQLCLEAILKKPTFGHIDWKLEAYKDRLTREHTTLGEIVGVRNRFKYLIHRYI